MHCKKYSHEVIKHLLDLDIARHNIMKPLPVLNGGRGKFAVNAIMKKIGVASNHLHSGYHQLLTSSKGFVDRVNKVREILEFMDHNPQEFISWILWGRSTYTLKYFSKKWKLNFWYLDSLLRGVHARYFGDTLPCFLREVSKEEFDAAIDTLMERFQDELTDRQQVFVNKLKKLRSSSLDLSYIPTGWKYLKEWVDKLGFHRTYMPVFRAILSQVYLLDYSRMINKIKTAGVTELLAIPFQNNEKEQKKIAYQVVSGPKYVIRRENNTKSLENMRDRGYFELKFKFLEDRWDDAITTRIYPSRKMRTFINSEVSLRSMVVPAPRGNDVDIQLVFQGRIEDFIAKAHLRDNLQVPPADTIGIDINRRGEYAIVSSLDIPMPAEILEQSRRWNRVLDHIAHLQKILSRTINPARQFIYRKQIDALHRRKHNLRKDYHIRLANWVGKQMISAGAGELVIEDLDVRTYGTRGALAKAIESMADESSLYAREIIAIREFTRNDRIILKKVSAYNSSRIHVNCGGRLRRDRENYDFAPCAKCNKRVNTHLNAAIYLFRSTKS